MRRVQIKALPRGITVQNIIVVKSFLLSNAYRILFVLTNDTVDDEQKPIRACFA